MYVCNIIKHHLFIIIFSCPFYTQEYEAFTRQHKLKDKSNGRQIVLLPLIIYTDDTSGNKSKVWNKFDSWCFKLAGLSKMENSKLHNIHFVSTSNKVSVLDQAVPIAEELKVLEESGFIAYDALTKKEVLVITPVLCYICDNPRSSEIMNHLGPQARKYCRKCFVRVLMYFY